MKLIYTVEVEVPQTHKGFDAVDEYSRKIKRELLTALPYGTSKVEFDQLKADENVLDAQGILSQMYQGYYLLVRPDEAWLVAWKFDTDPSGKKAYWPDIQVDPVQAAFLVRGRSNVGSYSITPLPQFDWSNRMGWSSIKNLGDRAGRFDVFGLVQ